jgi:hypothetical protein
MGSSDEGSDRVRAAVYLARDEDRKTVKEVLGSLEPEDGSCFSGVIEGELDRSQVAQLNEAGLVVELIAASSAAVPEPPGGPLHRVAASNDVLENLEEEADVVRAGGASPSAERALPVDAYNIDLSGPITREQRLELDALGVDVAAFEPGSGYRTLLTREQYAKVLALPYVVAVRRYQLAQAVTPELLDVVTEAEEGEGPKLSSSGEGSAAEAEVFDCLLHREADLTAVQKLIEAAPGTEVVAGTNLRIRFSAAPDLPLLATLAAQPEVRKLSVYEEPTL